MDNLNISSEIVPKQARAMLEWLAGKVSVIGEYLVASETDDLTGPNHCEYHNIGETLYGIGMEMQELVNGVQS